MRKIEGPDLAADLHWNMEQSPTEPRKADRGQAQTSVRIHLHVCWSSPNGTLRFHAALQKLTMIGHRGGANSYLPRLAKGQLWSLEGRGIIGQGYKQVDRKSRMSSRPRRPGSEQSQGSAPALEMPVKQCRW